MNNVLRVLVVDDEPLARQELREMLAALPGVEVAGEAGDGFEAVRLTQILQPGLLLLDIQMPRLNGFEVLELLGPSPPAVIFATAHDDYAVKAFEVRALDYLLKPIHPERLRLALERLGLHPSPAAGPSYETLLRERRQQSGPLERILIRDGAKVHVVPVGEVLFLEAQDDYVAVHTADRCHLKLESLERLTADLDPDSFCRIHRRFTVNIRQLNRLETAGKDRHQAVLAGGRILPVSRTGRLRLQSLLGMA